MLTDALQQLRLRLASPEAALAYALLGIIAGAATALVVIGFRELLYWPLGQWLPGGDAENFEQLPASLHFALPLGGALLLGLLLSLCQPQQRHVGVAHVIAALNRGSGRLPWANALVQLLGSLLALGSGQSGGREGPAVHLGAATSSLLGQGLELPNNSLRVLAACGSAAAVAASFNTPIAGVIFAMEVVMMEYTVIGFVPVMLAAVTATAINQAWAGSEAYLLVPAVELRSLLELPFIAGLGFACGALSGAFVLIQRFCLRAAQRPALLRMALAGTLTGSCALLTPQIMGTGYDSFAAALANGLPLGLLLALIATKLVATAVSCGLGMPMGVIGPSLLIGAFAGGALGLAGAALQPELASGHSFYVMLGMGAMMGALLNAPLAALLALVELTHNLELIFPAMLAITAAQLTHRELFGLQSSQQTTLAALQQSLRTDPLTMTLLRTSVMAVMERDLMELESQRLSRERAQALLAQPPHWLLVKNPEGQFIAIEQPHWQASLNEALAQTAAKDGDGEAAAGDEDIDLLDLLEQKRRTAAFDSGGTLREALDCMNTQGLDALYISGGSWPKTRTNRGILTRERIEQHYHTPVAF